MNTLFIHSDYIKYTAKSKTKFAEILTEEFNKLKEKIEEPLVIFCSFAEEDDKNPSKIAEKLVEEIISVNNQIHAKNIVLYPYVHLLFGKKPSKIETALKILKKSKEILISKKIPTFRVPFGWYKKFELRAKGHPLAELSRVITLDKKANITKDISKIKDKSIILKENKINIELTKNIDRSLLDKFPILKKYIKSNTNKIKDKSSIEIMQKIKFIENNLISNIEEQAYALLESAIEKEKPILPIWLSPTQIRLLPTNENMLEFSEEIAKQMEDKNVRVDIDDRTVSITKKVKTAEHDWIPYIIIVGPKEKSKHKFVVRFRETGYQKLMSIAALLNVIKDRVKDKPKQRLVLSKYISKRSIILD